MVNISGIVGTQYLTITRTVSVAKGEVDVTLECSSLLPDSAVNPSWILPGGFNLTGGTWIGIFF